MANLSSPTSQFTDNPTSDNPSTITPTTNKSPTDPSITDSSPAAKTATKEETEMLNTVLKGPLDLLYKSVLEELYYQILSFPTRALQTEMDCRDAYNARVHELKATLPSGKVQDLLFPTVGTAGLLIGCLDDYPGFDEGYGSVNGSWLDRDGHRGGEDEGGNERRNQYNANGESTTPHDAILNHSQSPSNHPFIPPFTRAAQDGAAKLDRIGRAILQNLRAENLLTLAALKILVAHKSRVLWLRDVATRVQKGQVIFGVEGDGVARFVLGELRGVTEGLKGGNEM
ncbi:MAG: hypothetical protein Q9162_003158 [Coniocarpon cinnabarinum]